MTNQLKRGEVWLANLDSTQGSEQAGVRPVIIFRQFKNETHQPRGLTKKGSSGIV
jgi:mRNA interferase MazF